MKTQLISRKNLFDIYGKVCTGWQEKIGQLLIEQQIHDNIEVNEELINKAYSEADNNQKKLIEKYFTINTPKDLLEEIQTFNDILRISGKSESEILPWKAPKNKQQKSQNALARIQLITEVYNQGTILDWNNSSQYKYYSYWYKENGVWSLYCVYCYDVVACFPVGCYFKDKKSCEDAANKFKNIYLDYLPE